jgi:uncharacterized membrane protein
VTSTGRLETFADGVFAIAITLLVLGISLPEPNTALWSALLAQWPALVAYVISFVTIGIMWISHHQMFAVIGRSNQTFAFINVIFLMVVAFVPYPTGVLAQRIANGVDATGATLLYGAVMVGIAIMFNVIWAYAAGGGGRLLRKDLDRRAIDAGARGYRYGPPGYLLITLLAFVSPVLSLAGFAAFAVYWVLPKGGQAESPGDA